MKTPRWLADEIDELGRTVASGEVSRSEAISTLQDRILEKDEELAQEITAEWVAGRLDDWLQRRRRIAIKEADRQSAPDVQGTLDEECSYFFPPDTFPSTTLLTESGAYAYDLLGRSERHHEVAVARVKFHERMVTAVGGNQDQKATLGDGITALRAGGATAAEG